MRTTARTLLASLALVAALAGPSAADDPFAAPPPSRNPPPPQQPSPTPIAQPAPPPPPQHHAMQSEIVGGQKETGFAFEVHLGSELLSLGGAGGTSLAIGALEGGFFAGYKLGRFIFGLGFDILRIASGASGSMQPETSQAQTAILFLPGARIAVLRSSDGRVELFGEVDFGFGTTINSTNPNPPPPQPDKSNFRFTYQIGPGLRFWAAPQFAFSGFVGLRGDFASNSSSMMTGAGTITANTSSGLTSIVASLQMLGVF